MRAVSTRTKLGGLAVAAAAFLSSCVVEEGPRPLPPAPFPGPQFCTRDYAPVCGRRGNDRQTFANGCLANAAGYDIRHPGPCRQDGPGGPGGPGWGGNPGGPGSPGWGGGSGGGSGPGWGGGPGGPGGPNNPGGPGWGGGPGGQQQVCTREYIPVCARRGNNVRTFGNSCEAEGAGFEVIFRGTCN